MRWLPDALRLLVGQLQSQSLTVVGNISSDFLSRPWFFSIHRSPSWSVWIVDWDHSRYGLSTRTAYTTAGNSINIMSYACSASCIDLDQYHTSSVGPLTCFWNKMHTTGSSEASGSSVYCPFGFDSNSISGDSSQCYRVSSTSISVSFIRPNWKGWSFSNLLLHGAALRAMFGANHLNTLQKPRNELNSVTFIGCCNPRIASLAFVEMPSLQILIVWRRSLYRPPRKQTVVQFQWYTGSW